MTLEGVLPVWKPAGFTSHDVVAKARRILGIKRIGHTGTLDPQVTGVLPLCIGRATRMVEYIQELPKQYEALLVFGVATDTQDWTGEVVQTCSDVRLTEAQVREALAAFVGEIEQVPPMYSAVKVDGKRLYELAREGVEIERKARKATIHEIEVLDIDVLLPQPEVRFRVTCSKGTYIRTLCVDIGSALGYPAVMKQLVRTATGRIREPQCLTLEQIAERHAAGSLQASLIPMDQAIAHLPAVRLAPRQAEHALQGKTIGVQTPPAANADTSEPTLVRVYADADERFLGLFTWDSDGQRLVPAKVFL
ncbi:tRNA pseudouridine(55) synthase TruB [Paenibacillus athensensis]|uniref:tRNA pseudouridine synthase B n=1 Tax=Paenibacillus athensensis TaxID=1967502 RepID=A0A4Y8Q9Y5_9BACL|nr:tRNA pseudouridine(55) synthase TruB [Paenibacillus athensensis]MCD1257772.1 tRNA pseudouridine(55) synthase TruB [Paenibacillus athensensis]